MLFLKQCCFLIAGILIHMLYGEQDLVNLLALCLIGLCFGYGLINLGSSSIMFALPNSSGFFSKEAVLAMSFSESSVFYGSSVL
jgi:hypothetical protein